MRRALAVLAALGATLALGACGTKQETIGAEGPGQPLSLELDFFPNADHAGIYAAQADGELRRAGIDLSIHTPGDPSEPLKLLAAGKVDLAISYEPELLIARDHGLHLEAVGALLQRPLTSIISTGAHRITRPSQLRGKTVGTAGIPYQTSMLNTILTRAHVPRSSVHEVNVGFNLVPAMISGKVGATLGGYWNYEAIQLRRRHRHPAVIRVDQAGVPTYDELVVVARTDEIGPQGELIRAFMQAIARGYRSLRHDPSRAVGALVKANPDLDAALQRASIKATLPAYFPGGGHPFGWMRADQWRAFGLWMYRHGLVHRPPDITDAFSNEFLAGQGIGTVK